ncbi:MAG: hypothetical protein KGI25_02140, partial [Thaumarchaeota archaeon]|nr:hypothetical protein [Nitrososphaerota archaeon]
MAKIKINLSGGELTIDFSDTDDLEAQIQKIDFAKIDALLETKEQYLSDVKKPDEAEVQNIPKNVKDLGTINL